MDLMQVKISEVKNLNLIYVFTTDSIFKESTNKYVGAKVVFDGNRVLSLDYKSEYFQEFIRRVIDRYNKEKDKRDIILLGNLSKKLVNSSSFACLDEKKELYGKNRGIPSFSTKKEIIKRYIPYLKMVIEQIIKFYNRYEVLEVIDVDGFNYKYIVKIKIGNVIKEFPIILILNDNSLDFRIGYVDSKDIGVTGTIKNNINAVNITWKSNDKKFNGEINYNTIDDLSFRRISDNIQNLEYTDSGETLIEDDLLLLTFYSDLLGLQLPKNIVKVNDTNFIFGEENKLNEDEDNVLFNNIGSSLNINDDYVLFRTVEKNCLSKYNNQINTVLDMNSVDVIMKKINIDGVDGILVERKYFDGNETLYRYEFMEIDDKFSFDKPFNVKRVISLDDEEYTFESVKKKIKKRKEETL